MTAGWALWSSARAVKPSRREWRVLVQLPAQSSQRAEPCRYRSRELEAGPEWSPYGRCAVRQAGSPHAGHGSTSSLSF